MGEREAVIDNDAYPGSSQESILGADGQFHVTDEPIDISQYRFEDWVSFVIFWALAFVVFYQVFTRYILDDAAGWTEEIARYLLVGVVFIGAAISVRKNNHIQVDFFYRLMPRVMQRVVSTAVDVARSAFLGYAIWLSYQLTTRIGGQRMAIVELPMGLVFGAMTFGFALMFWRSLGVAWQHWKQGYSVLERPETAIDDKAGGQGVEETR
jgi:TRAP-type C4-dicarboxylate transport system permease small subunit